MKTPWYMAWWALNWEMWDDDSDEYLRPVEYRSFKRIQNQAMFAYILRCALMWDEGVALRSDFVKNFSKHTKNTQKTHVLSADRFFGHSGKTHQHTQKTHKTHTFNTLKTHLQKSFLTTSRKKHTQHTFSIECVCVFFRKYVCFCVLGLLGLTLYHIRG